MGEGPGVFLESIPQGDQEEVTLRVTGGRVGVGTEGGEECRW